MLTQDEIIYLKKIPQDQKSTIYPFDPKAKETGLLIVSKIRSALPDVNVLFMGSTALEIAGQNDIDIYILADSKDFDKYLPELTKIYGKPKNVHKTFIEWSFTQNHYPVELYLTEPPDSQIKVFEILKADKHLLKQYDSLKLTMKGKSQRDYQRKKYEFYNKLLNNPKE